MTFSKFFSNTWFFVPKRSLTCFCCSAVVTWQKRQVSVYLSHAAEGYMSEQILIERLEVNLVLKLRSFDSLFTYIKLSPLLLLYLMGVALVWVISKFRKLSSVSGHPEQVFISHWLASRCPGNGINQS